MNATKHTPAHSPTPTNCRGKGEGWASPSPAWGGCEIAFYHLQMSKPNNENSQSPRACGQLAGEVRFRDTAPPRQPLLGQLPGYSWGHPPRRSETKAWPPVPVWLWAVLVAVIVAALANFIIYPPIS